MLTPAAAHNRKTVIRMGLCFLLIFGAFNACQNLVTSLLPEGLGFISLCVLYATVCVLKPVAPLLLSRVDTRWAMAGSALLYSTYVGSLISVNFWAVILCAALLGAGAAVLWTANGKFLTALSTEGERGNNVGLFWTIFSMSGVVGNLISFVYLHWSTYDPRYLMGVFTAMGLAGALLLTTLKKPIEAGSPAPGTPTEKESGASGSIQQPFLLDLAEKESGVPRSIQQPLLMDLSLDAQPQTGWSGLVSLLGKRQTWLLLPLNLLVGAELSFNVGAFPTMLPDHTYIGLVMMCTGIAATIGGYGWGKLSVKIDRRLVLALGTFIYVVGLVSAWLFHLSVIGEFPALAPGIPYVPYAIAVLLALGDTCFNVLYISATGDAFDKRHSTMAFAFFQFFQAGGAASVFLLAHFYGVQGAAGSLVVPLTVGAIAMLSLVAFMFAPLSLRAKIEDAR